MSDDTYTREAYSAYVEACRELNHEPKTLAEWNGAVDTKKRRSIAPVKWVVNHFNEGWAFVIAVIGLAFVLIKPDWHLQPWWITTISLLSYGAVSIGLMIFGIEFHRARLLKNNKDYDDDNYYDDSGFFIMFFIFGFVFSAFIFTMVTVSQVEFARVNAYFEDTSCKLHSVDVSGSKIAFFDNTEDGFHELSIKEHPTRSGNKSYWISNVKIEDKLAEVCN